MISIDRRISWKETMLEDALGLCPPIRAVVAKVPTDIQRKNAQALPEAERREIFAFVQDRQDLIVKLLSAAERSTEEVRQIGTEAIIAFRQKETHFSRSADRFSGTRMRVLRAIRPNGSTYATGIIEYFE